jgi:hypothetical protein
VRPRVDAAQATKPAIGKRIADRAPSAALFLNCGLLLGFVGIGSAIAGLALLRLRARLAREPLLILAGAAGARPAGPRGLAARLFVGETPRLTRWLAS